MSETAAPQGSTVAFRRMWSDLETVGLDARSGGYHRFAWTRIDHDLREWFAGESATRGLDLTTDLMGNQWAWWGDPDAAVAARSPGVVVGSHLDSVADGGAFDGPLGVVSSFAALDALRESGFQPARPIGVVNFVDEEGSRFGVACAGSRVITGAMSPDRARRLTDVEGTTLADAFRRAGGAPEHLGRDEETLSRVGVFVELHVEQGRLLDELDSAVGVGSDIWAHGRWRVDVPGMANHAGTTALAEREDAVLGLAAAIIAARRAATEQGCLATVGKVAIVPGDVNAIPSGATGWLDARGPDADAVRRVVEEVRAVVADFDALVTEEAWTATTTFDPDIAHRLSSALGGLPMIGTGAGHDAGVLAAAGVPTAMLFVRNPTGVSHSPDEWAYAADCLAGVAALTAAIADLSGSTGSTLMLLGRWPAEAR